MNLSLEWQETIKRQHLSSIWFDTGKSRLFFKKKTKKEQKYLELSEILPIFAAENPPLYEKYLGQLRKINLERLIPPCMINTWVKPPQGGFII